MHHLSTVIANGVSDQVEVLAEGSVGRILVLTRQTGIPSYVGIQNGRELTW